MKKLLLSAFVAFAMLASTKTLAQQGFGTNEPDKSAAVEILSNKRGLLIPRLNLTAANVAAPVISPAQSLLVYNQGTSDAGVAVANRVTPGFYYWDTNRWVRFRSEGSEKTTVVTAGNAAVVDSSVSADGLTTTYKVGVTQGNNGQVLVSRPNTNITPANPDPIIPVWVNASDFIKGVNGINVTTDTTTGETNVGIGGALTKPGTTEIITNGTTNALAIKGLTDVATANLTADDRIVIMDANGVLKMTSKSALLDAKDLTLGDGLSFEAGITGNDGVGAVLKATKIEIKDESVTAEKLVAATDGTDENKIPVANADGSVVYKDLSTAIGEDLTTDGIIVVGATSGTATANTLEGAVLTPTYLKIQDNSITAAQIATGAVGADELAADAVTTTKIADDAVTAAKINQDVAGAGLTQDANGALAVDITATGIGKTLTGDGITVTAGTTAGTTSFLAASVLADVTLGIANNAVTEDKIDNGAVTSDKILDGTIQPIDMQSGGNSKVLVTNASGNVSWIDQSALPSNTVMADGTNTSVDGDGSSLNPYKINVATANGTTLGIVKEAASPTVNINANGELSVNTTNLTLSGDVTGSLNATKVEKIQGTAVSAALPSATNNVLKYNTSTSSWTPSQLQGSDIAGAALSSSSISVTPASGTTNAALLEALTIDIKPGTAANQILTTIDNSGTLTTDWTTPNSLVTVANGLNKDNTDIELGGALKRATIITTGGTANPTFTLGVKDLVVPATVATEIMYAEGSDGVLRKAARSISQDINNTSLDVEDIVGYNAFVQEIVIKVTLPTTGSPADIDIVLPDVNAVNKGQVVNIKIVNTELQEPTNYVNIRSNGAVLTYGGMPYQGWIVKSNGTAWEIVGRN